MDDNLLLDAIERYKRGEMAPREKTFFEELRKNNPAIDQMAVEHTFFLQQLEKLGERKNLKYSLDEVENTLVNEGVIAKKQLKGKTKVIYLWNRYRKMIAVAATIAFIISISAVTIGIQYSEKKANTGLMPLVAAKINKLENKVNEIANKVDNAATSTSKPKFTANFRATGFLIDGSGYLATNAHVVTNAKNLIVENKHGEQFTAVPVYVNNNSDLAILKVIDSSFKKLSLPYSIRKTSADLGEQIFTLGYPREEVVYGEGYLSAKSGYSGDTASYQISISVNPGNSGGPVINRNGEVIGIISSKETNADGVVFAIKSKNIYSALEEIKKDQSIKLPVTGSIKGMERVQQIKKIEDFVFMVKGN